MVDILCAVLSGGNWGPTVDGFTTNKLQAAFAGNDNAPQKPQMRGGDDDEEKATGIGARSNPSLLFSVDVNHGRHRRPFLRRDAH